MQDEITEHLSLPLPHHENKLDEDVLRLRNALSAIDLHIHNANLDNDGLALAVGALSQAIADASAAALTKAGNLQGLANLATARGNLGLGTAATSARNTSSSDVVAGRLMRNGDHGLGGIAPTIESYTTTKNLNNLPIAGLIVHCPADTLNLPAEVGDYIVTQVAQSSAWRTQNAVHMATGNIYQRQWRNSVLSEWKDDNNKGLKVQNITANTNAAAGTYYVITTAGVVLMMPAAPKVGDEIGFSNASSGEVSVNWNGRTVKGVAPSPQTMIVPRYGAAVVKDNGSTWA